MFSTSNSKSNVIPSGDEGHKGVEESQYPVAEFAAEHSLALRVYPELSSDQIEYVVKKIKEFI